MVHKAWRPGERRLRGERRSGIDRRACEVSSASSTKAISVADVSERRLTLRRLAYRRRVLGA